MPRIDFYVNYELQASVQLDADEVLIGRNSACQVQVPDDRVSRRHAVIRATPAGHEIVNEGVNGTKINGNLIAAPHRLAPGDAIFIGSHVLIYQLDEVPPTPWADGRTVYAP